MIVTVREAKTQLSRLIALVLSGEEVIIARRGTPLVRIDPIAPVKKKPVYGAFKGQFKLTDAFFEPLSDNELAL